MFKGKAANLNVVIKEVVMTNTSSTGLDISSREDKNQRFKKGVVQAIGNGCPKDDGKDVVSIGNEILYDGHKGNNVTLDSIVYTVIDFRDIVIIFDK